MPTWLRTCHPNQLHGQWTYPRRNGWMFECSLTNIQLLRHTREHETVPLQATWASQRSYQTYSPQTHAHSCALLYSELINIFITVAFPVHVVHPCLLMDSKQANKTGRQYCLSQTCKHIALQRHIYTPTTPHLGHTMIQNAKHTGHSIFTMSWNKV